jgi:ketosteroid isomerase-like protein
MSAAENKAATQAAYEAFANLDIDGATKNMADDIEWVVPGNSKISGTYRGKDEVIQFVITIAGKSFQSHPQHFIADGDHVVVLTRNSADGHEADAADVLTFRDGKVVKFQGAADTALEEKIWGTK